MAADATRHGEDVMECKAWLLRKKNKGGGGKNDR